MDYIHKNIVVAFDTANETIAVAVGELDVATKTIRLIASVEEKSNRASNTRLLPIVDKLFSDENISRERLACVAVGTGPGSFTGVRIAMSTAKGIATALGVPLVGVSTLNSIAQGVRLSGHLGKLLVLADAMRKEVYPAYFNISADDIERLTPDTVVKFFDFELPQNATATNVVGDALKKYRDMFDTVPQTVHSDSAVILPEALWEPTGAGLLAELQQMWQGENDILDAVRYDPMRTLPVYTRLSDAEESERERLSKNSERDLKTGVQGGDNSDVAILPFDANFAAAAAEIESLVMGNDAWSQKSLAEDLQSTCRSWWMAVKGDSLVGYAGGMLAGDEMEILKIAVLPEFQRLGIATKLLMRLAEDARNLAGATMCLEVRASNAAAREFYKKAGFENTSCRPRYYSDGEDAIIMRCDILRIADPSLSGLSVSSAFCDTNSNIPVQVETPPKRPGERPYIMAIETSCDETACAVVAADDVVLSDIVASQVDFHARFGGVVPEIASRKHVEAIAGVARLALADASGGSISWGDLDAIAVTYAPGLVGALVVGVAFAKGAAWALDIPIIAVNHLEGHLYANKFDPAFSPPAVVSLVSGGNTMLVHMKTWGDYDILGGTIDDAVGEAFDKVAKLLGLPYPGGPHISRLADGGNPEAIDFPRALLHSKDFRFSLSGLKTAVLTYVEKAKSANEDINLPDVCASFQAAVIEVQVEKARRALNETGAKCMCVGGGVSANSALRNAYQQMCDEEGATLVLPPVSLCTDNAVMIGLVAHVRFAQGKFMPLDGDAYAHADLSQPY